MSWPTTKQKVTLAVTRFAPDDKPVAGLTPDQRDAHRDRRQAEQRKVEPAIDYPDWRLEELALKYADDEPREPRRGFYDPYG